MAAQALRDLAPVSFSSHHLLLPFQLCGVQRSPPTPQTHVLYLVPRPQTCYLVGLPSRSSTHFRSLLRRHLPQQTFPDLHAFVNQGGFPWHPVLVDVTVPSVSWDSHPLPWQFPLHLAYPRLVHEFLEGCACRPCRPPATECLPKDRVKSGLRMLPLDEKPGRSTIT